MQFKALLGIIFVSYSIICTAQQVLKNETIVKMHSAGLGDDLLITTINSQPGAYDTGADDLISLKTAGISDKVITAMVTKNMPPTQQPNSDVPPSGPSAGNAAQAPPPLPSQSAEASRPRVFLQAASKGPNRNAARDQSMEMSKDFEKDCPGVRISINQQAADYTVVLNHIEAGLIVRDNQFQIADKNGDLISKTSEGGSIAGGVKKACQFILSDWTSKQH